MAVIAANCPEVSKPLGQASLPSVSSIEWRLTVCQKCLLAVFTPLLPRPPLESTTITFAYETPSAEERLLGSNFASCTRLRI